MPSRLRRGWGAVAGGGIIGLRVLLGPGDGAAQPWVRLGPWDASVELGVTLERHETKRTGGPDTELTRARYDERLTLGTRAVILDPRLFTSRLSTTLGLFQERTRFDGLDASLDGTLLGYSLHGVVLGEKPYSATLFASRTESVQSREFGGRSEVTFENRGITLRLREDSLLKDLGVPYFSSTLGVRQELTREDTTVLGQRFRRDEVRTVLTYDGAKGFETSDLTLRYEFSDLDDRESAPRSFQAHSGDLVWSLDWGETLNRRWDSRIHYFSRSGSARSRFLSVEETLRIDHYENLFTDYRYRFTRLETTAGTTTIHGGQLRGQHRLYRNLTTTLLGHGTLQDLSNGERTTVGGQLDLDYQRTIPWDGRLSAGVGARYQLDENRLSTSRVEVIDERHTAPTALGGGAGFTLANPFVLLATIDVVDARGGARLPAVLGTDYIIVQDGNLTRIVPLAGSPVIIPGDPLLVSYAFEVAPGIRFSTLAWRGILGADFRWISISVGREQSEQDLLGGRGAAFLENRTVDTVRLELRGEWERVRVGASAQYRAQDSTRLTFTAWQFSQLLTIRPVAELALSLSAHESFTEFTVPSRRSTNLSARGDLSWTPAPSLFVHGFVSFLRFDESTLPEETVWEAGLRARWRLAKLDVVPTLAWSERARGPSETTSLRVDLRVVRRF